MPQWEYSTLEGPPDPNSIHQVCMKQGLDGWELAGVLPAVKDFTGGMILKGIERPAPQAVAICIFKRQIAEQVFTTEQAAQAAEMLAEVG